MILILFKTIENDWSPQTSISQFVMQQVVPAWNCVASMKTSTEIVIFEKLLQVCQQAIRQKKNMCVSGFPTLPSFWHLKHPTLNFFWIDLPDLEGNQAILLKKRSEKLFSRICLSKLCPVNSKSSLALPETTESRFVWSAEMLTADCNTSSTQAYE